MFRTPLITVALLLSVAVAQPAAAQDAEIVKLSTAGFDFQKAPDTEAFYRRLQAAVHRVCDASGYGRETLENNADCRERAMTEALQALGRPELAAVHQKNDQAERLAATEPAKRW